MNRLVLATYNSGKKREFQEILQLDSHIEVLSLADLGYSTTVVENGRTFCENAKLKAEAAYQAIQTLIDVPQLERYAATSANDRGNPDVRLKRSQPHPLYWCLADDSGLEVDALAGAPGIYSARYAGESSSDQKNMEHLLYQLQQVPKQNRTARFRCALYLVGPSAETRVEFVREGICEGNIEFQPRGTGGFGYDPIFVPAKKEFEKVGVNPKEWEGQTLAQIPSRLKNMISHRAQALSALLPIIKKI